MNKEISFQMLPPSFYKSFDTITLAQKLLGCTLVHESEEGKTAGIIVETEAYLYDDPASHSFRGQTPRNAPMFGEAGLIYVYLIYGMYECFNIVSNQKGRGEAVLIRALEPTEGIELMQKRRNTTNLKNLCSGPGKLTKAMGISRKQNGIFLNQKIYCIAPQNTDFELISTTRIGISQAVELPYRFYIGENRFVSKF
jgi:DNA-3-methyladenine glycosylase